MTRWITGRKANSWVSQKGDGEACDWDFCIAKVTKVNHMILRKGARWQLEIWGRRFEI